MKNKFISYYFDIAERTAELSYAKRLKVGAVIVKDHRILSYGYNGTPVGFDNSCEEEVLIENDEHDPNPESAQLVTRREVIHAEQNALMKIARSSDSSQDAVMFITHSPCIECAKLILQSGINTVYYKNDYRSTDGINLLKSGGIEVLKNEKNSVSL